MENYSSKSNYWRNHQWLGNSPIVGVLRTVLFVCFFFSLNFSVYGHNEVLLKEHNTITEEGFLAEMACNTPTSAQTTTSHITPTSARLNCSAIATHYYFKYRESNTSSWTLTSVTTAKYINLTGLKQNTTYEWQCRIYCNGQWSGWPATESFTTTIGCTPPLAAHNSTQNIDQTSAKLVCHTPGNLKQFRHRTSGTSTWTTHAASTIKFEYLFSLSPGTPYEWQSKIQCTSGIWSDWSATKSFTTIPECSPPTAAQNTTTNITQTAARLNCSASGLHRNFRYRASTTSSWTNGYLTTSTVNAIGGLTPNTLYYWQSKVYCDHYSAWSDWSSTKSFTTVAAPVCNAPTAAQNTTSNITQTAARLNCSASGYYRAFQYRANGATTWTSGSSTVATYQNISGLSSGTTYEWQSKVQCNNGTWSPWSATETFTTTGACNAPTAAQNTTPVIQWTHARLECSAPGIYREFRYKESSASSWTSLPQTTSSYKYIYGLSPGTTYNWQSKVYCNSTTGWSTWSPTETFTTIAECNPPTAAQNTTSNITSSSARLNCTTPGIQRAFRYRKSNTSSWTSVSPTSANYSTISGLSSSTAYDWQSMVKCTNGMWSGWSLTEYFTTTAQSVCNAPTAAQNYSNYVTASSARLNCSTAGLQRAFRYRVINTSAWTQEAPTSGYHVDLGGLSPSTTYEWQSMVKCTNGQWSPWSPTETFTTSASTSCNAPTAAQNTTSHITSNSARLNCSAVGPYRDFRYRPQYTSVWTNVPSGSASFYNATGLSPSRTYQWQSRVKCTNGLWSGWSATETFTTLAGCFAPLSYENTTTNITQTSARLNCSASGTYRQFRHKVSTGTTWTTGAVTSSSFTNINGLNPSTTYHWQSRVYCSNPGQWSDWSVTETFTTTGSSTCNAPTAAQNTTSNITSSSARLNSTASGTYRQFRHRPSNSSTWITGSQTSASYRNIYGLSPSTTYYWQSRVYCSNGQWSAWSVNELFGTTAGTCYAPTTSQNTTSNITSSSARLNSSASGTYRQFRHRPSNSSTWITGSQTSSSYRTIYGLSPSTTYYWQSRVKCANGVWSNWSPNETFTTLGDTCNKPHSSQNWTSNITTNSARLNCSANGIYRDFRYRKSNTTTWTSLPHTTSSYKTIYGLSPLSYYYWQSRVYCSNGKWSDWSVNETFVTPGAFTNDQTQARATRLSAKNIEETTGLSLLAAPNPQQVGLKTRLHVTSNKIEEVVIVITDLSGKKVIQQIIHLEPGTNQIQLNRFDQPGIYLISVQSATEIVTSKLLITE